MIALHSMASQTREKCLERKTRVGGKRIQSASPPFTNGWPATEKTKHANEGTLFQERDPCQFEGGISFCDAMRRVSNNLRQECK